MDPYKSVILNIAETEWHKDPDRYPSFEYTYTTPQNGFTLGEFILKIRESLEKYLYIVSMIYRKFTDDPENFDILQFKYDQGKYYVTSNWLSL
jgi:hypothetical protein